MDQPHRSVLDEAVPPLVSDSSRANLTDESVIEYGHELGHSYDEESSAEGSSDGATTVAAAGCPADLPTVLNLRSLLLGCLIAEDDWPDGHRLFEPMGSLSMRFPSHQAADPLRQHGFNVRRQTCGLPGAPQLSLSAMPCILLSVLCCMDMLSRPSSSQFLCANQLLTAGVSLT